MAVVPSSLVDRTALGFGDPRVCIAVLDGAVDLSHPCFDGAALSTVSVGTATAGAALDHGTAVASLIFGQPGTPVTGLAPACRGLVIPVFSESVAGVIRSVASSTSRAPFSSAVEHGAHVVNISGGQLVPAGDPYPWLAKALETCHRRGVLVVAAAGNDGCDCLHVPAAAEGVLAVGAMDGDGRPWMPATGA